MASGPTFGLPSWSPPIQVPNESGKPASGTRRWRSRVSSVASSIRLCSKNQSPWRISSTTRGRSDRTSSVSHSAVTSSAISSPIRS